MCLQPSQAGPVDSESLSKKDAANNTGQFSLRRQTITG